MIKQLNQSAMTITGLPIVPLSTIIALVVAVVGLGVFGGRWAERSDNNTSDIKAIQKELKEYRAMRSDENRQIGVMANELKGISRRLDGIERKLSNR